MLWNRNGNGKTKVPSESHGTIRSTDCDRSTATGEYEMLQLYRQDNNKGYKMYTRY